MKLQKIFWILVLCSIECVNIVKTSVIPPYRKLDAYVRACNKSGAWKMINDYDRMSDGLNRMRGLDFGVVESWSPDDKPRYKGCEPMKSSKNPIQLLLIIAAFLKRTSARPNPILDDEEDESEETKAYRYPDLDNTIEPYWKAYSNETKNKLKLHDHLEIDVLNKVRRLDFKLREAWTRTDKPFAASH